MLDTTLFQGFDPSQIAAIHATHSAELVENGKATANKSAQRHFMRRAKAERTLADILPARFEHGDSWHVISHGDIDALSYLRHALAGVTHFDHVLLSTWCIAKPDIDELTTWLDSGRIDQLDFYVGEIFPNQYGDEYEQAMRMSDIYGARLVIAKNHSKVTLASHHQSDYHLAIESSANVNTNPRIEQSTIHCSKDIVAFYRDFYHGLRSIDRASKPPRHAS